MKYEVITTDNFLKQAKPLLKKYSSLKSELKDLEQELLNNPKIGTLITGETYKIRLAIKSKGKGKSGGARVITHLELDLSVDEETTNIFLLTIYDKSDKENIPQHEIEELINEIKNN